MWGESVKYSPTELARQLDYVREDQSSGQNHGARVNAIQRFSLGGDGDSWCCEFATMLLDVAFKGASPIPRLQACEDVHLLAAKNGWISATPSVDDLVLSIDPATGKAHHIAIVTATDPLTAIAGNTSEDGASSNGDGVHEHAISGTNKLFVHYPR